MFVGIRTVRWTQDWILDQRPSFEIARLGAKPTTNGRGWARRNRTGCIITRFR